jgi:anti-anti-sigma factor
VTLCAALPPPLVLCHRSAPGGEDVIALAGELDLAGEDRVRDALASCRSSRVVVDLALLDFIDARGVAALCDAGELLEAAGAQLEVRGAHGIVRRVLEQLRADGLLGDLRA